MNQEMKKANRLGEAPIGKLLVEFSVPAIIAMLANALYNVVDSIFVGQESGAYGSHGCDDRIPNYDLADGVWHADWYWIYCDGIH